VKAEDVKVLDMHELVSYTDFMVVCTGQNTRLTRRIAEEVAFRIKEGTGVLPTGTEGSASGEWILLDFLDFVVHVFTPQSSEFYRLDVLWKQAPAEDIA
jgi:ribosome-associated protein